MALKPFRATVANADIGSLKSLHTLFDTYLNYMLAKFEANIKVRNVQNFEFFDEKQVFFKKLVFKWYLKIPFLTKRSSHVARRFCS